jgi:hypothetical protein
MPGGAVLKRADVAVGEVVEQLALQPGGLIHAGIPALDATLRAVQAGELVLVLGAPSMGKTSLILQAAMHTAQQPGTSVLMGHMAGIPGLAWRILRSRGAPSAIRHGGPNPDAAAAALTARVALETQASLAGSGLLLVDVRHSMSRGECHANLEKAAVEATPALVCLGGWGRLHTRGEYESPRRVFGRLKFLKTLAQQHHCVVMAGLSTWFTGNARDRRPMPSDLGSYVGVLDLADVVLWVHRESYYRGGCDDAAEILVLRSRAGTAHHAHARFSHSSGLFAGTEAQLPVH